MTSETDEQFVERMKREWDGDNVPCVEDFDQLINLARRGAAAAAEIERLRAEVKVWQGHTKTAVWSDSEECKMLAADNERLRAELQNHGQDEKLSEEIERLRAALRWYRDQAEGCRKLGSIGDPFRHALDKDGGERARAALVEKAASVAEIELSYDYDESTRVAAAIRALKKETE